MIFDQQKATLEKYNLSIDTKLPMDYQNWNNKSLAGWWTVSKKIDGIFVQIKNGHAYSKAKKSLMHIPEMPDGIYEAFTGCWNTTMSAISTINSKTIQARQLFSLDPLDPRLFITKTCNPTAKYIKILLDEAIENGHEGLVIRQGSILLKVKKVHTEDIAITGHSRGTGKNLHRVGALTTLKGNVGTGLSDKQRIEFVNLKPGTIIEVKHNGYTRYNKFKNPRFVRVRLDKTPEL